MAAGDLTVNATCSLPDAITAANTDTATGGCPAGQTGADTITITEAGTTDGTITLSSQLRVNGSSSQDSIITIEGGNFTVSGDDSVRVFQVRQHGDLTVKNLIITEGKSSDGGAIKVDNGGKLTLESVTVRDSEATGGHGGGIRSDGGTVTITNSAIFDNETSDAGGGLELAGTATITGSQIYGNTSPNSGGGLAAGSGKATNITISGSSIYNNTSGRTSFDAGGGLSLYGSGVRSLILKNSTVYANTSYTGSGLYIQNGTATVTHVTFTGNVVDCANCASVRNDGATLKMRNTIVANTAGGNVNNPPKDCSGSLNENFNNLIEDGTCSPAVSGDPKLASMTTGMPPYYVLEDDSPAIGAANDTYCAAESTDQAGNARPATGCDIGAVENSRSAPVPTDTPTPTATATVTSDDVSITVDGSCSLPDAITAANDNVATNGCPAGGTGRDTITITQAGTSGGTITLSSQLSVNGTSSQDSIITIEGGNFTVSGNDSVRVFLVQQYGDLTIKT